MSEKTMIPVNLMVISGEADTPREYCISHGQLTYISKEQWEKFTMRLNDLVTTMNSMADDNKKEPPNEEV